MKLLRSFILLVLILLLPMQACVEKEYNWSELDTSGIISIPPIPLGSMDTLYIEGLPQGDESWGIPIPDGSVIIRYTMYNLFDPNAIKKFFYEGNHDVEISAKIDFMIAVKGIYLDMYFNILDENQNKIKEIIIPSQRVTLGESQSFTVKIAPEYMKYMTDSSDLRIYFVLSSKDATVWISDKDYIYIWDAIIKTGGFYYEL
ncbi:hypothetical protein [Prevotella sp. 10(H)]|uniref:hypothetical protein n=1 Tax=Prevotella sp. 10(H) TaxID=1158294 RepID=UPI0004A755B2|nr:hypothetical protein [Prevotella sp. 10(H)]